MQLNSLFSTRILIEPKLLCSDLYLASCEFAYVLLSFTNGYFIYDFFLSVVNWGYPGRTEIILHHTVTIICITVAICTRRFVGYCITGLIVEVNNIFLHIRQLFTLAGLSVYTKQYLINSSVAIGTCRVLLHFGH